MLVIDVGIDVDLTNQVGFRPSFWRSVVPLQVGGVPAFNVSLIVVSIVDFLIHLHTQDRYSIAQRILVRATARTFRRSIGS